MLQKQKGWPNGGSLFSSGCFPSLKRETVRLAGLSAHSCLALELWLEAHHCTAAWLMDEGRRRKTEDRGKEVEKQSDQPCRPWDLPWPATATPPLEEQSAQPGYLWPPPQLLHRWPLPWSGNLLSAQSSLWFSLLFLIWTGNYQVFNQGGVRSLCPCFCALPVLFGVFTPPNDESLRLHGVNMWALQVLKYHPLPGKQWRCRQPYRLVTSLFFDPPTFL